MKVSVIIRTYNEAEWLAFSLDSVLKQEGLDQLEIFIVDSGSSDATLLIAQSYKKLANVTILHYEGSYLPGKSLNMGVVRALDENPEYVLILSAHCVIQEKNAVFEMTKVLSLHANVRAVYGRQLPLEFSDPVAWRDMTHLYQSESRLIEKHPSLNNAFSLFAARSLAEHMFDNNVTNLEDILWASEEIKRGFKIFYSSNQSVSHHHGPNHSNNPDRLKTSIGVIKKNPEVFGTKISSLNISENDLLRIAFVRSFREYEAIFDVIAKHETCVYCSSVVMEHILNSGYSEHLFFIRRGSDADRAIHKEYELLQKELITKFPRTKYILSFDGSIDARYETIPENALFKEMEDTFPDIIWPVVPDNSKRLSAPNSAGGFDGGWMQKESSLRVMRGNGTAIKVSKMDNLSDITYSTKVISEL